MSEPTNRLSVGRSPGLKEQSPGGLLINRRTSETFDSFRRGKGQGPAAIGDAFRPQSFSAIQMPVFFDSNFKSLASSSNSPNSVKPISNSRAIILRPCSDPVGGIRDLVPVT